MKTKNLVLALFFLGSLVSCEKKEIVKNDEAKLINASFGTGEAVIDTAYKKVIFKIPLDVDITTIIPTFTFSTNATIYPPSGVATNYTEPVVYTITSEDTKNQYVFTVYAYKPIAEFTVYDCSSWTPEVNSVPLSGVTLKIYSNSEDVATAKTFDILTTNQNAKATFYGKKGITYFLTASKDTKSNIINGYVLNGTYNSQTEIDNLWCDDPNATIGGFKYKDINGDGCVWPDDRYNYDFLEVPSSVSGIRNIDLYIANASK